LRAAWFSRLLRHPARRRSGSSLSPGTRTGFNRQAVTHDELVLSAGRPKGRVKRPSPVTVAPSGPAGRRKDSKLPRPKPRSPAVRPSTSASSSMSRRSSVCSIRSQCNYARPMPAERIPFSKFGLECVVPLARQEVFAAVVDAYSITGADAGRNFHFAVSTDFVRLFPRRSCSRVWRNKLGVCLGGWVTVLPLQTISQDSEGLSNAKFGTKVA